MQIPVGKMTYSYTGIIKFNVQSVKNIGETFDVHITTGHTSHVFIHRFLLHLSCQSAMLEGPANFSVVETNAFKHLNHLSLRLAQGSDKDIKDYLAVCLSSLKVCPSTITHQNDTLFELIYSFTHVSLHVYGSGSLFTVHFTQVS